MHTISRLFAKAIIPFLFIGAVEAQAQTAASVPAAPAAALEPANPKFDAELAKKVGADDYGMKSYVLVILKNGPNKLAAGKERDDMFKGHFANIQRMASEGKLMLAGPLDGADGWRGLFVLAVADFEEAKKQVAIDPVITKGEMVAEYHKFYGSAALTLVNEAHQKVSKKSF